MTSLRNCEITHDKFNAVLLCIRQHRAQKICFYSHKTMTLRKPMSRNVLLFSIGSQGALSNLPPVKD